MKAAFLAYHSVFDDEIRAILERSGCQRYYEIPKAWACDEGGKRFGTHIHPGNDSVIVAFFASDHCSGLVEAVRDFKTKGTHQEYTHLALFQVDTFV
jgi:hypothetical protein